MTTQLNYDNNVQINVDNIIRHYNINDTTFILFPKVGGGDIVHTINSFGGVKHHFKRNFMTLSAKHGFIKLYPGLYVGINNLFVERYFSFASMIDINKVDDYIKNIIVNFNSE